jgi:hypothetical protein
MCLDNHLCFTALFDRQTRMVRQANLRREPELCLTIRVRNVNMDARFFAGEEKESELSVSYNCGGHKATVLQRAMPINQ